MQSTTLALALILGAGFAAAKIGQIFRLPSVTGYIVAGLLLGPSCFGLITHGAITSHLDHFTQIALMLIAFGIGEHLELKRLRHAAWKLAAISSGETLACFALVCYGSLLVARWTGIGPASWTGNDLLMLSMLLGAVSIATAPDSTLHVIREEKAAGPLTTTLMQVVALNNGLAFIAFGIMVTITRQLSGDNNSPMLGSLADSFRYITFSLLIGIATGLLMDLIIHRLKSRGEMLTAGLALLLICGESARLLDLSPLLAGMAAGFTIVNRDHRDVRLFREINAFEPPIYVLFFTLAGAHLVLSALLLAGWLGFSYFLLRAAGKYLGARVGAIASSASTQERQFLGLALMPHAGVAIGLVFLLQGEESLKLYAEIMTPVVLTGVLLSEIFGPIATRIALDRAGETAAAMTQQRSAVTAHEERGIELPPWTEGKLIPPKNPHGTVLFGASHSKTVAGLARISTLLAHFYKARPLAVRIVPPDTEHNKNSHDLGRELFHIEEEETRRMGYELNTAVIKGKDISASLVDTARQSDAMTIVLGHPINISAQEMLKVVELVARTASCQVIVARFSGLLHSERILVPLINSWELTVIHDILAALAAVGRHRITLLKLMSSYVDDDGIELAEHMMENWTFDSGLSPYVFCKAVATDSRLETVINEARHHDLLIMAANPPKGIHRLFFGSLAADVAQHCAKPMLMVHRPVDEG
ncbi:MAG: cation:proton antiporter [Proteobacteria bacterium]|nr:hypothetical protein [Desulfobulbaceae bacterium]MBU4152678.1 cation:proton antiporter [Pseudomonadota bacterium]